MCPTTGRTRSAARYRHPKRYGARSLARSTPAKNSSTSVSSWRRTNGSGSKPTTPLNAAIATAPSRWTFRGKASARPTRIRGPCSRGRKPASTVTRASPTGYRRVPTTLAWHRTLRPRGPMRTSWNGDPRAYPAFQQGGAGAVLPERLINAAAAAFHAERTGEPRAQPHPSEHLWLSTLPIWALVNRAAQGGQPMVVAPAPAHCTAAAPATNESHVRRAGRRTARQIGHYWSLYLRQVAIWAKSLVTLVLGGGRSYENTNPYASISSVTKVVCCLERSI